ncbi:anthranilate synthase subunit II [Bacillus coahuilensis m2-6]|uniref:anthranilate synthase component II n=1 Tax=Bacillus coahuilensis TaxID=408580 RepID=UPI000750158A|nr:aminodeoxychorismate/anthranilate synthase component II [Bacillus coahuilensis]KUP08159.1 anthranilate synthase subunit II [Bacillus coahuilensis m2-6]
MIVLLDNYDSFTFNIYQYLLELKQEVMVIRNDEKIASEIEELSPSAIVISPGPGNPEDAGVSKEVIEHFTGKCPILGICLGHQCIGEVFGARITGAKQIKHGKTSMIKHSGNGLFDYLSSPLEVMRYHSLVVDGDSVGSPLRIIATSMEDGEIMAIQHEYEKIYGIQFHPESIGTTAGKKILENFVNQMKKEAITS